MATFRLRHFSNVGTLKSIAPERLLALVTPHHEFFSRRGYSLPVKGHADQFDYQELVRIFMTPDANSPRELLDALFLIDEMSTPEAMDSLIGALIKGGHKLDDASDQSPADVAVQVWLLESDILERKHAEQFLYRPKSFEYYQTDREKISPFVAPSPTKRLAIEKSLDDWFETKKRGRCAKVFVYPEKDEVRILVRHGEPFKREESVKDADVESVCYRPLKYDVVVYNSFLGELRVNAQLAGEKTLCREQLGHHLFGDAAFFNLDKKYTLEPLREYGLASMACGDIEGIESVTLSEVHFMWGGAYREIEVRKATDVFAAYEARSRDFPEKAGLVKAVLKVKFTDAKTERSVTIRPPNVAQYTRDSDAVVLEQWLEQRGFILHSAVDKHAAVA